ncbi:MAG TPA: DUF72 domain-containing protein [Longimicrobiales bacterium]|nr:DUF72 domain-containing protein [Longimicrobiales bacterium]
MTPRYRIGTQGWNYDEWTGWFYPPGTKSNDRLELYSRAFDTVEVDSTFYAMPPADRFRSWYERTPAGFLFTLKLPRDITHDARLVGADEVLFEFCNRCALLEEKRGPILVQLPPDLTARERSSVEAFVRTLPAELEFAIEFRHATWFVPDTFEMLRRFDVTLAASVGPWLSSAQALRVAAAAPGRFQYLRWLGSPRRQELNAGIIGERDAELEEWARAILYASGEKPLTYAYFNNDYQGHSPESARRLQQLLGVEPVSVIVLQDQRELF